MQKFLTGVNLGGWLVLEKWMTPTVFQGYTAEDEWSFCHELGNKAGEVLERHRKSYITQPDFAWLAEHGIDSIRLPVGHGVFGDEPPYIGAISYVDFAMRTAAEFGMSVLLDIHTAPGSQNGWDHSGQKGEILWPTKKENMESSIRVAARLAERYGDYDNLFGIEVLNEPHWSIDKPALEGYYRAVYTKLREQGYKKPIIFHDAFDPYYWSDFLQRQQWQDVYLDMHLYQCFSDEDKQLSMTGHLHKTRVEWGNLIRDMQKRVPVIIGEWSLGLDPQSLEGLSGDKKQQAFGDYAAAQLSAFLKASGSFFWNYKTENMVLWSFRECVSRTWL